MNADLDNKIIDTKNTLCYPQNSPKLDDMKRIKSKPLVLQPPTKFKNRGGQSLRRKYFMTYLILIISVVLLIVGNIKSRGNLGVQISIERMDHSIINDAGKIMATIYYDKPVAIEGTDAARNINAFFEQEYQSWLSGSSRRHKYYDRFMDIFLQNVDKMRETYGDDSLAGQPLYNTVTTEIILNNQQFFSIKQTDASFMGGPSGTAYYGTTFDAQSGERIPFDDIVTVDADAFRESLSSFFRDFLNTSEETVNKYIDAQIKGFYSPNELHNYDAYVNGHLYELNYEYYYDGEYFYIPENEGLHRRDGEIVRWNGKVGAEFEASFES